MGRRYHQVPIIDFEGKNLEEKESRQDLDIKLVEDREIKNVQPHRRKTGLN